MIENHIRLQHQAPEPASALDWGLLRDILRHRARLGVALGLLLWGAATLLCLRLAPRSYTATASVALQQSPGAGGALAALSGLSGVGSKTYQGVIRSRRFAEAAAAEAHIQAVYGLPSEETAVVLTQKAVLLDDRMDGLLYISVSLPAPPALAGGSRATAIRQAAAAAASSYVRLLSNYLATSNTDRDASLIREAAKQLGSARAAYNESVRDLGDAVRASHTPIGSMGGGDGASAVAASSQLPILLTAKAQLEGEIASGAAEEHGAAALASGTAASLSALPGEDPLLQDARKQVALDQTEWQNLRIGLSDDNPDVVVAHQKLQIAQARLAAQVAALRQGHTSDAVRQQALQAKYATVLGQIAVARREDAVGRTEAVSLDTRRSEVALRLEVLKTTATQYAALSLQKVAGNNLMDVVDTPLVPVAPRPGLGVLCALSFFLALLALQLGLAGEYVRRRLSRPAPDVPAVADRRAA